MIVEQRADGQYDLATGVLVDDTPPVVTPAPANTKLPSIVGTPTVGVATSYVPGAWTNTTSVTHTWRLSDAAVGKAFVPTAADVGKSLVLREFGNGAGGTTPVDSLAKTVVAAPVTSASRYAGDIPNQVRIGFSAPKDNNALWAFPGWTEAREIIRTAAGIPGLNTRVHRTFTPSTNQAQWLPWLQGEHADNYEKNAGYPLCSVKCASYVGMYAGDFDTGLSSIREWAKTRRTSGPNGSPQPFALTFDHEPDGNPGGNLTEWGRAHNRLSNYFAGWTTNSDGSKGTYTAANDVSDILAWHMIPNGHWWGPKPANLDTDKINAALPAYVTANLWENRGVLSPDCYDPDPDGNDPNNPLRDVPPLSYPADADRASKKIQAIITWAKVRNPDAVVGFGEFSATTADEIDRVATVLFANRHNVVWASCFNSAQNSRFPWRLIPDGYPPDQHPPSKGGALIDFGGNVGSESRLNAYVRLLVASTSPANTGPTGA